MRKTKAIVLLSGGQDSTTCLAYAKKHFAEVVAVAFDYGQKHVAEIEQARKIAEIFAVEFVVFNLQNLLFGSSLVDHNQNTAAPHKIRPDLPSSFTAGRNALFLTLAASFGFNRGITHIVTGICQTDYSGYPDCREDFRRAQQKALSKALDCRIKIHAPLMFLTKAETWKLARELSDRETNVVEIVRLLTLTDYNGDLTENEWGYGRLDNPASVLRARGYFEAKEKGWI